MKLMVERPHHFIAMNVAVSATSGWRWQTLNVVADRAEEGSYRHRSLSWMMPVQERVVLTSLMSSLD